APIFPIAAGRQQRSGYRICCIFSVIFETPYALQCTKMDLWMGIFIYKYFCHRASSCINSNYLRSVLRVCMAYGCPYYSFVSIKCHSIKGSAFLAYLAILFLKLDKRSQLKSLYANNSGIMLQTFHF